MRKFALIIAFVSLAGLAPMSAAAQTETDAREMFQEGNTFLQRAMRSRGAARQRALRQALNLYHRSLRVTRARSVLFNVALCYEYLRRYQDAFAYYTEYLAVEDLEQSDRRAAEERLAGIRPHVALVNVTTTPPGATVYVDRRDLSPHGVTPITIATRPGAHTIMVELQGHEPNEAEVVAALGETRETSIELSARPATLHIETDPPGAEIRIDSEDGEPLGVTPLSVEVEAGSRRIYATLDDRPGRTVVEAPPGEELNVTVELRAPTTPGVVAINVDVPDAMITVDGESLGAAPIAELELTPGIHRISVVGGDDYQGWSEVVEVGPGHNLTLDIHLAPTVPTRRFGAWPNIGMVVATMLGVSAAATGGWALSLHADFDDIERLCTDSPQGCADGTVLHDEARDLARRTRNLAITTDVLMGTALALAVTSFALMLLNHEVDDSSGVTIALSPLQGGAVATLGFGAMLGVSP